MAHFQAGVRWLGFTTVSTREGNGFRKEAGPKRTRSRGKEGLKVYIHVAYGVLPPGPGRVLSITFGV